MERLFDHQCKHHIFVCVRNREGDMPCCGATASEELYVALKKEIMKRGLV